MKWIKKLTSVMNQKNWGWTIPVFQTPFSETHFLYIKKGGYCSEHIHTNKHNRFFLIFGKLDIIIFDDDEINHNVLEAGDFFDVEPNKYHKFEALTKCLCIESYWTNLLDPHDIERRTIGGIK